jgi:hypothetical protein
MKYTEIADRLRTMSAGLNAVAALRANDDFPDNMVLPLITHLFVDDGRLFASIVRSHQRPRMRDEEIGTD